MDDLSDFVNHAVRRRIFDLTVANVRERSAHYDQDELLAMIDEEVDAVRRARSQRR